MFKAIYSCDQCGTQKKETNHWFVLRLAKDCSQIYSRLEVRAFDDGGVDDRHICGHECLTLAVSSFAGELAKQVENVKADV